MRKLGLPNIAHEVLEIFLLKRHGQESGTSCLFVLSYMIVYPPSIRKSAPVVNELASDARN